MLALEELLHLDDSLKLCFSKVSGISFLGITLPLKPLPNHLIFIKDQKLLAELESKQADNSRTGLILPLSFWEKIKDADQGKWIIENIPILITSSAFELSMSRLSLPFYQEKNSSFTDTADGRIVGNAIVHPTAQISQGVFIGEGVEIGSRVKIFPGVTILSGAKIEEDSIIYPNVTIYHHVVIGKRCRIHAGVVIGADGFGYHFHQGVHHKFWHVGGVVISDDVEIGANSTIDGGTFVPTTIGSGTKIDNQVQIGHNCQIGKNVILCGQVGVAGSAIIEDYCVLGGKAGVGPGVRIGLGSQVAGSGQVNTSWPAKSVIGGHPARPLKEWLKGLAYVRKESLKSKEENKIAIE